MADEDFHGLARLPLPEHHTTILAARAHQRLARPTNSHAAYKTLGSVSTEILYDVAAVCVQLNNERFAVHTDAIEDDAVARKWSRRHH